MNSHTLSAALTAILVPVVLGWLLRSAQAQPLKKDGIAWLRYGTSIKGFALFGLAIVMGLCALWFLVKPKDQAAVLVMILLFAGLTLPLAIECFFVRIGFDEDRIYCHSGWRKSRII